jgi:hypothetical protein
MLKINWMTNNDPILMLGFLNNSQRVAQVKKGRRRLRLFACACCRGVLDLLDVEAARTAIAVSERYADGQVDKGDLERARKLVSQEDVAIRAFTLMSLEHAKEQAELVFTAAMQLQPLNGARHAADHSSIAAAIRDGQNLHSPQWHLLVQAERRKRSELLREVFGNPLRPLPHTSFPDVVRGVAEAAYQAREANHYQVLADAVEEHGQLEQKLGRSWRDAKTGQYLPVLHLRRSSSSHVKGCHVVDWLRGLP